MSARSYPNDGEPTYRNAFSEAWSEFTQGVSFEAFCLQNDDDGHERRFPAPIAWLLAPWKPLAHRFTPYALERLLRPRRADRLQRMAGLSDFVFWFGGSELSEEEWAEADALVAELGGDFPPRDWEPMSAAEAVGAIMGMSREEVAEVVASA